MDFFKAVISLKPLNKTNINDFDINNNKIENSDVHDSNLNLFNHIESKMKSLIIDKFERKFVFESTNNKVNEIFYFLLVEIGRLLKPENYTEKVGMNINTEEVNELFEKTTNENISNINVTKEDTQIVNTTSITEITNESNYEMVNIISASPKRENNFSNKATEFDSWEKIYSKIEMKYKLFNARLLQSDKPEKWGYGANDFNVQVIPSNQIFYSQEKEQKESSEELGCEKSAHKEVNTQDFFDVSISFIKFIIFILEFKFFPRMDYRFWNK